MRGMGAISRWMDVDVEFCFVDSNLSCTVPERI